ncbi:30S ribosomal protein S19 [Candidatus Woesearchaeota archaeon]|nr:30S ribosomal protein S19 [uncultured archaeon]MBS3136793.1 30S ribosomal protein S19 [Candidatus Woesearchaeota archaeon]
MVQKIFTYRGKTLDELKKLSIKEFAKLVPARQRRSLLREPSAAQKIFYKRLEKKGNNIKTHNRDLIIIPALVGKMVLIYQGKEYVATPITEEMIGHYLGEFALTRKKVSHSAPGIGATRSSASVSVR